MCGLNVERSLMAVAILAEDRVRQPRVGANDHNEHKVLAQIMSCRAWRRARPSTFSTPGSLHAHPAKRDGKRERCIRGCEWGRTEPRLPGARTCRARPQAQAGAGGWDRFGAAPPTILSISSWRS